MMKVLENAALRGCAKAHHGSRLHWSNVPGRPVARKAAICKPNSCACAAGEDPNGPSAPHPSSQLFTTCSRTELSTRISLGDYFVRRSKTTHAQRLVKRLEQLGYAVD